MDIFYTYPFLAPLLAACTAESLKVIGFFFHNKKFCFRMFFETGGMPSGHSTFVSSALTTAFILEGANSPILAVTLVFAIIIMYDAIKVRANVGRHAKALNEILGEKRYTERVGHSFLEVAVGFILGASITYLCFMV